MGCEVEEVIVLVEVLRSVRMDLVDYEVEVEDLVTAYLKTNASLRQTGVWTYLKQTASLRSLW